MPKIKLRTEMHAMKEQGQGQGKGKGNKERERKCGIWRLSLVWKYTQGKGWEAA